MDSVTVSSGLNAKAVVAIGVSNVEDSVTIASVDSNKMIDTKDFCSGFISLEVPNIETTLFRDINKEDMDYTLYVLDNLINMEKSIDTIEGILNSKGYVKADEIDFWLQLMRWAWYSLLCFLQEMVFVCGGACSW